MLAINNVYKKYENKVANEDITLNINDGEIFGFIGPNGAGKSTLIKSIVGLHKYDSGSISLDNISIKDDDMIYKSKLAYIPDNPDLYDHLTGIKYLEFVSNIYKIDKDERLPLIEKYADLFEIKGDLATPIGNYSHGMKQKLAIIGALIHKPKLLVMDEPFVGLDPKSSHTLKEIMKEFVSEGNIIFFSSHVLEVVEKLCPHVAIISNGKLVYEGNPEEITDKSLEEFFLEKTNE